ncbi:hypothetical protein [Streptomyces sp. NPDC051211]|uniref:hypothetical protein n=1 Tax=Streptomyces sp. NPDC051211 TaxID=3154643 RepID=UPI00344E46C4
MPGRQRGRHPRSESTEPLESAAFGARSRVLEPAVRVRTQDEFTARLFGSDRIPDRAPAHRAAVGRGA